MRVEDYLALAAKAEIFQEVAITPLTPDPEWPRNAKSARHLDEIYRCSRFR